GTFAGSAPLVPFGKTATSPNAQGTHIAITGNASIAAYVFGADSQLGSSFTIAASSSAFDTTLVVFAYDSVFGSSNGTLVAYNDDFSGTNSQVSFTATAGVKYIACVKPFNNAGGPYTLTANYGGAPSESTFSLNNAGDGSINTGTIPAFGEANTYKFLAPTGILGGATISLTNQTGDGDIYVFDDAGNLLGGNNTGGTGVETITLASVTAGATYHITVIPENYAAQLTQSTVSVDVVVIARPAAPSLDSGSDTGYLQTDGITKKNASLDFFVNGTPGSFVRLFRDGVGVTSGTVGPFGLISLTDPGPLADGTYTYTATAAATSLGSQTSASSGTSITIDTQAPALNGFTFIYTSGPNDHAFGLQFDASNITLQPSNISVKNLTTNVTLDSSQFNLDDQFAGLFAYTYNPTAGVDRLPSGNYELRIPAAAFADYAGNTNPLMLQTFFFQDGDADHNGKVDVGDLGILATNYGLSSKAFSQGDFNYDTKVDVGDLGILATNYGVNISGGSGASTAAMPAAGVGPGPFLQQTTSPLLAWLDPSARRTLVESVGLA
ncbi:MAG TPA: Ig-like domain-containing protein, partial [Tepidisphaeraceae bacterium]|nr:Ig-like domain-containing protein [Tepidisphaeraceae bacterium]